MDQGYHVKKAGTPEGAVMIHPLNCDTCNNLNCEYHDTPTTICNFAKVFFQKKGCASHSDASEKVICCAQCPCRVPDCEEDCPHYIKGDEQR